MSSPAVVVVQSGDLAAWVGALSGLAGVILGAGIDGWRRSRADKRHTRAALARAGTRLATASTAYRRAAAAAGDAQNEPQWRALLDTHLAEMGAASVTINEPGNPEITQASLAIIASVFNGDLTTPQGTVDLARDQGDVMKAYRDAVQKAKL